MIDIVIFIVIVVIKCPAPDPQQLQKSHAALSGSCQITAGSKCSFKCMYGHQVAKKETLNLECKPDGQWSHAIPQCIGESQYSYIIILLTV